MTRNDTLNSLQPSYDLAIIGGGATGIGIALDSASRGYSTLLLEQADFGKGTSSRSTKLIHGGVRYLQQGNVALVMEALKERGILLTNAPHLVHDLPFIVPNYAWWETPFYGIGMRVYDMLAGRYGFGSSRVLSTAEVLDHIPTLDTEGLRGGVLYYDGQFDDARLLIDLALTAIEQGALLLNYAPVTALSHDASGFLTGLAFRDLETNTDHHIAAKCIINATGPFSDSLRQLDDPAATPMIAPSQGVHLVLSKDFLPGDAAIMVPRTSDGRVLFAIPWHNHTLLGTTDTPITALTLEPTATDPEIDFILDTAARYLTRRPTRSDILSLFTGIRPLVHAAAQQNTASLSREHTLHVSKSGLLTIAGGKWTTYRKMAEDAVDHAATLAQLEDRPCITRTLPIHGHHANAKQFGDLWYYGSAAPHLQRLMSHDPALAQPFHPSLTITPAYILHAIRHELARTLDDLLARRTHSLFLNAKATLSIAPQVAHLLAAELNRSGTWESQQLTTFREIASHYLPT